MSEISFCGICLVTWSACLYIGLILEVFNCIFNILLLSLPSFLSKYHLLTLCTTLLLSIIVLLQRHESVKTRSVIKLTHNLFFPINYYLVKCLCTCYNSARAHLSTVWWSWFKKTMAIDFKQEFSDVFFPLLLLLVAESQPPQRQHHLPALSQPVYHFCTGIYT